LPFQIEIMIISRNLFLLFLFNLVAGCGQSSITMSKESTDPVTMIAQPQPTPILDTVYLGAGCFWCIEAIFQQLEGVLSVSSGYTGGTVKNPSYREVCTGTTGHAEVAQIVYQPEKITFDELLEVFWQTHDGTSLNRQGADVGTQYRSAIFYTTPVQKETSEKYKAELNKAGAFDKPLVTEITEFDGAFYIAEDYHQNYYNQNKEQGYCTMVIKPKVEKFQKVFKDKLKGKK
jgi:peptide-methionine (S)-S-oxide reductase